MLSLTPQTTTEAMLPKAARHSRGNALGQGAGVALPGESYCLFWSSVRTFDRGGRIAHSVRMDRPNRDLWTPEQTPEQTPEARLP